MEEQKKSFTIPHFPHDISASNDPKLITLRIAFGWAGIGMFWSIIEGLHREPTGTMAAQHLTAIIGDFWMQEEMQSKSPQRDKAKPFEEFLYANALLTLCDGYATSNRVAQNLNLIREKSEKARESAKKRWQDNGPIKPNHANAKRTQSEGYARKEEKSKEENRSSLNPQTPKKEEGSEEGIRLASGLLDCIKANNPNYKHDGNTVALWSRIIDLMLRVDKRPASEIEQVILFCQRDSFWRSNILSAGKLREKYDQLVLKSKGSTQGKTIFIT